MSHRATGSWFHRLFLVVYEVVCDLLSSLALVALGVGYMDLHTTDVMQRTHHAASSTVDHTHAMLMMDVLPHAYGPWGVGAQRTYSPDKPS